VAHNRDKFNCHACVNHRHCDDSNPAPFPMFVIEDIGLESRTCLLPMIDDESRHMLQLFTHYKNGILPFSGGLLDQPAAYSEAMATVEVQTTKATNK
jgi:hypothetical protein